MESQKSSERSFQKQEVVKFIKCCYWLSELRQRSDFGFDSMDIINDVE